jgi:hypothetical protein
MKANTGFFSPHTYRRKQTTTTFPLSLNNQQHHHASSLHSAHSTNDVNESLLPLISTGIVHNDGHRPYRQNDFANNHLFIAKRKLAGIFLGQPTKNLQSTSDLIHLFDEQEPKRRNQNANKHKRQVKFNQFRKKTLSLKFLLDKWY